MAEQDQQKKKEGALRLYKMIDRDSDGSCDKSEIRCFMFYLAQQQGETVTDASIDEAMADNFKQLDSDGNGTVDFEEFYGALF